MEGTSSYDSKRNWFLWGTALTWVLSIPFVVAVFNAFRGISEQKATGLGAVAGGLTEGYVTLAIVLAFVLPVGAIVLLVRSFAGAVRVRKVFSVLYICWNALMLTLAGLFVWGFIHLRHMVGSTR
jgi:hypothetical protein